MISLGLGGRNEFGKTTEEIKQDIIYQVSVRINKYSDGLVLSSAHAFNWDMFFSNDTLICLHQIGKVASKTGEATEKAKQEEDADKQYFSTVQEMVSPHLPTTAGSATKNGVIAFIIDANGKLTQCKLESSSGSPALDRAVMAAIRAAAPYPVPPNGQVHSLRWTYGPQH